MAFESAANLAGVRAKLIGDVVVERLKRLRIGSLTHSEQSYLVAPSIPIGITWWRLTSLDTSKETPHTMWLRRQYTVAVILLTENLTRAVDERF